jgi:hypothetical protein
MALTVTTVPRNLATKVTFLYLEFEDLFIILARQKNSWVSSGSGSLPSE